MSQTDLFPLEPHQECVLVEHNELGERLAKLNSLIEGPHITGASAQEQSLLRQQRDAMTQYLSVLKARISLWSQA